MIDSFYLLMTGWWLSSLQLRTSLTTPVLLQGEGGKPILMKPEEKCTLQEHLDPTRCRPNSGAALESSLCSLQLPCSSPQPPPPSTPAVSMLARSHLQHGRQQTQGPGAARLVRILSCPPWRSLRRSLTPFMLMSNSGVKTKCPSLAVL